MGQTVTSVRLSEDVYVVLPAYPPKDTRPANPPRVLTAHTFEQTTCATFHCDASVRKSEASALVSALVEAAISLAPTEPTRMWPHQEVRASAL